MFVFQFSLHIYKECFSDADCILPGEPYIYLGNKATDKRGKQCEIWRTVTNYNLENLKGFNI